MAGSHQLLFSLLLLFFIFSKKLLTILLKCSIICIVQNKALSPNGKALDSDSSIFKVRILVALLKPRREIFEVFVFQKSSERKGPFSTYVLYSPFLSIDLNHAIISPRTVSGSIKHFGEYSSTIVLLILSFICFMHHFKFLQFLIIYTNQRWC